MYTVLSLRVKPLALAQRHAYIYYTVRSVRGSLASHTQNGVASGAHSMLDVEKRVLIVLALECSIAPITIGVDVPSVEGHSRVGLL